MNPPTGQRKVKHAREQSILLLIGYAISIAGFYLCKAPTELYTTFAVAIGGVSGAFVYGNAKEHQANAKAGGMAEAAPVAPEPTK